MMKSVIVGVPDDQPSRLTSPNPASSKPVQTPSPFGECEVKDIEDLYVDCLVCVTNMIGCDARKQDKFKLIEHLRKSFRLDSKRHLQLFEAASNRPKPKKKLNLTFVEARDLASKDVSGLNDPFCTFFLKSSPDVCYNTECKLKTLNPVWNESFELDLPDRLSTEQDDCDCDDILHVDVRSFVGHDAKRLGARIKKLGQVRDGRGLKHFISEMSLRDEANTQHKLIGSLEIPVRCIPASGFNKWWRLEKISDKQHIASASGNRRSSISSTSSSVLSSSASSGSLTNSMGGRGEIRLALHLSTTTKSKSEVMLDHQRILRVLLAFELLTRNSTPYSWKDDFSKETLQILSQHAVQGRLTREETALTRWMVYCQVHCILPIDHRVFTPILQKLQKLGDDLPEEFHRQADSFTTQCMSFVAKHRKLVAGINFDKYKTQLEHILKCLHILHCLEWRSKADVVLRVESAVKASLADWYEFVEGKVLDSSVQPDTFSPMDSSMRDVIRVTHLLVADVTASREQFSQMFAESLNMNYAAVTFKVFEGRLRQRARAIVQDVCTVLLKKRLTFPDDELDNTGESDLGEDIEIGVGTRLFELYLALQQFYDLGKEVGVCSVADEGSPRSPHGERAESESVDSSQSNQYHQWFIKAVAKWLDIALFKAMKWIAKAVQIDNLKTVDELVRFTTSAVDIRTVFGQIGTFWKQLKWPDPETSYVFISRILDDVCRAAIFYAEKMSAKVKDIRYTSTTRSCSSTTSQAVRPHRNLFFSHEECLAINNIDYVLQVVNPLVADLGTSNVLARIEERNGGLVADVCRKSVKTLVRNAAENVENQIAQILEELCSQMSDTISQHLIQGLSSSSSQHHQNSTQLMQILDENLIFLKDWLVEANFERALHTLWATCVSAISRIMEKSITDRYPSSYFTRLYASFRILLNFFFGESLPDDPGLPKINRTLKLFSCNAETLIQHYYSLRYEYQSSLSPNSYPFGSITIRALVQGSHLRVEVLNARHLKPIDVIWREKLDDDCLDVSTTSSYAYGFSGTVAMRTKAAKLATPQNTLASECESLAAFEAQQKSIFKRCYPMLASNTFGAQSDAKFNTLRNKFDTVRLQMVLHQNASGGHCCPYVTVRIVPEHKAFVKKVKTRCQQRTLFPLFDETFDLVLPESVQVDRAFLQLTVKDKSVMGEGLFMAEAFLPLASIVHRNLDVTLQDLPQNQLALTRPSCHDEALNELLFAIKTRSSPSSPSSSSSSSEATVKSFLARESRKRMF